MEDLFGGMFNGMFGQVGRGMCKISINGDIAIRTKTGYKVYDLKKNRLINCNNFAFNADGLFWVVPVFKVEVGDIILVNGQPNCVIEVADDKITTFSYENSTINTVIPEHHVFMGKTYCYGKIFTPFTNMTKDGGMNNMMTMMMMSQMFNGDNSSSMNPMLFMMMGNDNNPFAKMFDGAFNFNDAMNNEEESEEE